MGDGRAGTGGPPPGGTSDGPPAPPSAHTGGGSTTLMTGTTTHTPPTDLANGVLVHRDVAGAVCTGVGGHGLYVR